MGLGSCDYDTIAAYLGVPYRLDAADQSARFDITSELCLSLTPTSLTLTGLCGTQSAVTLPECRRCDPCAVRSVRFACAQDGRFADVVVDAANGQVELSCWVAHRLEARPHALEGLHSELYRAQSTMLKVPRGQRKELARQVEVLDGLCREAQQALNAFHCNAAQLLEEDPPAGQLDALQRSLSVQAHEISQTVFLNSPTIPSLKHSLGVIDGLDGLPCSPRSFVHSRCTQEGPSFPGSPAALHTVVSPLGHPVPCATTPSPLGPLPTTPQLSAVSPPLASPRLTSLMESPLDGSAPASPPSPMVSHLMHFFGSAEALANADIVDEALEAANDLKDQLGGHVEELREELLSCEKRGMQGMVSIEVLQQHISRLAASRNGSERLLRSLGSPLRSPGGSTGWRGLRMAFGLESPATVELREMDAKWQAALEASPLDAPIVEPLQRVFECARHPLGALVNRFSAAVCLSAGEGAIVELTRVTQRFMGELSQHIMNSHPVLHGAAAQGRLVESELALALEGVLFQKTHGGLITLLRNTLIHEDRGYMAAIWRLRNAKMGALGVPPIFHTVDFSPAVHELASVLQQRSPARKATALLGLQEKVLGCCAGSLQRAIGADELLPILMYLVIQAQVPHLVSEIRFTMDFLADSLSTGELGYHATCMDAVLQAILNLGVLPDDCNNIGTAEGHAGVIIVA